MSQESNRNNQVDSSLNRAKRILINSLLFYPLLCIKCGYTDKMLNAARHMPNDSVLDEIEVFFDLLKHIDSK